MRPLHQCTHRRVVRTYAAYTPRLSNGRGFARPKECPIAKQADSETGPGRGSFARPRKTHPGSGRRPDTTFDYHSKNLVFEPADGVDRAVRTVLGFNYRPVGNAPVGVAVAETALVDIYPSL